MLPLLLLTAASALPSPPLLVHDARLIAASRARIAAGDPLTQRALAHALDAAAAALPLGPFTVTRAPHPAPSGDPRDYYSIAKYYWPCNALPPRCARNASAPCDPATGLPWAGCDGLVNPITSQYALPIITNFSSALAALAAGYAWTGRADFASRAALLVRAFLTDPATGMRPSMDFAQAEPGLNNGSHWGIIELSATFVEQVLDSVALIAPSGAWADADQAVLLAWLRAFGGWLRGSALGRAEYRAFNNHQIWYTTVLAACDAWLGDAAGAAALLNATLEPPPLGAPFAPLGVQIAPDGELPAEEARTNSAGYVNFASLGLLTLGALARSPALRGAGAPDLLSYTTRSHRSGIRAAVDFVVPFALGEKAWPFQNLTGTPWSVFAPEFGRAANVAGWEAGRAAYAGLVERVGGDPHAAWALFWPLAYAA